MIHLDFHNIEELKAMHYAAVLSHIKNKMTMEEQERLYANIRAVIKNLPDNRDVNDYSWLERFILADVNTLESWVRTAPELLKFTTFIEIYTSEFATIDKFVDAERTYNAYTLLKSMDIHVCPYCEDEYFDIVTNVKGTRRTNDFDHFYPKGKKNDYPALAMCFYNLIPSGKSCNFLMNNANVAANPYHPDIESWSHFQSNVPVGSNYETLPLNAFTVTFVCRHHMVINESILSIQERYNNRNQEIKDILVNAQNFSEERLAELEKLIGDKQWIASAKCQALGPPYPEGRGHNIHLKLRHDLTGR